MSQPRPHLLVTVSTCLAGVALVAGCSSSGSSTASGNPTASGNSAAAGTSAAPAPSAAPAYSAAAHAPASGKIITAKLSEFHIDMNTSNLGPGTYTVRATNVGKIVHALTFDGKGIHDKSTGDIEPGKSGTVTVTLAAGMYEIYCPVGNHKMQGMDMHVQVG